MVKLLRSISFLALVASLGLSETVIAQTTVTIGTGTSSSSTRGPFQRADTNSTTVFSRWHQVFTASELATAGVSSGVSITSLNWELASSNTIIGTGDASLKIYVKNSSATQASTGSWTTIIAGSTLVHDTVYNTTNNFPGANGWMPFAFDSPFTYTGGALEVSVDWDCSQVSTPAFSGNGAIKFRWSDTAPDTLVVKKTASSSAPSTLSDLKDERANIQIVYINTLTCDPPSTLHANTTPTTANVSWTPSTNASSYNWKVVMKGAGSTSPAIDSGSTTSNMDTAMGLMSLMSYDLYVMADCGSGSTSAYAGPYTFMTRPQMSTAATIGMGTSSSSTRGPFQRSDTNSSTVYSRFVHIYTQSELDTAGVETGDTITALNWELASSNIVAGNGNATFKVYVKNSNATSAQPGNWNTMIAGSDLLIDHAYNTTHNFPGANGWMSFEFNAPFVYSGGSIEIAVDWDCSQVTTPAFSGDGAIKWRWESTAPDTLVVKKTSSSSASSNISDQKVERANIQFVYVSNGSVVTCDPPTGLMVSNVDTSSADLSWTASATATSYSWKVVTAGSGQMGMAIDSGSTTGTSASTAGLAMGTSYDFYVLSDCGADGMSTYAGPETFTTTDNFGIDDIDLLNALTISPNPTNGIATIHMELAMTGFIEVSIYSMTGELIATPFKGNAHLLNLPVDLSLQADGLYFVRLSVNDQSVAKKIVLLK